MTATATTAKLRTASVPPPIHAGHGHHPAGQRPGLQQVVEDDLERPRLEQRRGGLPGHADERQRHGDPVGPEQADDAEHIRAAQRTRHDGPHTGAGRARVRAAAPTKSSAPPKPAKPAKTIKSVGPVKAAKPSKIEKKPLNFKVAVEFRREFKTYASTHDLKLNRLLELAFESYRKQHGR